MERNFKFREAKKLSNDTSENLNQLDVYINNLDNYEQSIKQNIDDLITLETLKIIKKIPIDEINRNKEGIRIKILKESGLKSIYDVYYATSSSLENIKGISDTSAFRIKQIANQIVSSTKKEIKVKLSTDNISNATSKLVLSISQYIEYLDLVKSCSHAQKIYNKEIKLLIKEINPAKNPIKWLFTSKTSKEKAIESYDELIKLVNGDFSKTIEQINNTYNRISQKTSNQAWSDFAENNIIFFNVIERVSPGVLGTDDSFYGLPEELAKDILNQEIYLDGFKGILRNYQEMGVKYILHQKKVLLGDEMGLGKTIQAIASMVSLSNIKGKYFIVICPASVIINWCREIEKFSTLKAFLIHGDNKQKNLLEWIKNGGVAVINYESIQIFDTIKIKSFSMLIVDEAHYIKNPEAQRTINVKKLCNKTDRILFMTGTALENKVDEMINIIYMLNRSVAKEISSIAYMSEAQEFRVKVVPVYYRRKRDDVLTELPDLIENKEWCQLNSEEERIYEENILSKHIMTARRLSWDVENLSLSSKANRLKELIEEAEEQNRKVIVYSFFLDTIKKIYEYLGEKCALPINGSISPDKRQQIIDEFSKSKDKSVLICQIQAGGTGLNIQCASVVIICEPQYKPSIENQAISRAYRMGQSRNVLVYRLLCENTIDERITNILDEKTKIFDAFADKSIAATTCAEIDNTTLSQIVNDEIKRIQEKRGVKETCVTSNFNWYQSLLKLNYKDLVNKLIEKYGAAKFDYFTTNECNTKQKNISRTSEGLYCHHIDEDKIIDLSNKEYAKKAPFSYQKADRLVYCNLLEHLLLHVKIIENWRNTALEPYVTGIGGIGNFICPELNDIYSGTIFTEDWKNNIANKVGNDYESYLEILDYTWKIIKQDSILLKECPLEKLAKNNSGNVDNRIIERLTK